MAVPQKKDERYSERYPKAVNDPKYGPRTRPTLAYSSSATSGQGVRNVRSETTRSSNTPGSPTKQQQPTSSITPTHENFQASYAKQGLQPSSIEDPKNNPYKPVQQINRSEETTRKANVTYSTQPIVTPKKLKSGKLSIKGTSATLLMRGRATTVTGSIWSWAIPSWFLFQLPFALLNIVFFALAGALDSIKKIVTPNPNSNFLYKGIHYAASRLLEVAGKISEAVFGINVSVLDPINLFMVTELIIFIFGIAVLLIIYLIYKLNGFEPISGKSSGIKIFVFILCFFGYFTPVLNLLPWFMIWTMIIWLRPK